MEIEVVTNNEQLVSCLTESKESKNTLQRLQIELQSHLSMVQDHTHTHNIGIGSENPGMDDSMYARSLHVVILTPINTLLTF